MNTDSMMHDAECRHTAIDGTSYCMSVNCERKIFLLPPSLQNSIALSLTKLNMVTFLGHRISLSILK
jgi:hypothetical protein